MSSFLNFAELNDGYGDLEFFLTELYRSGVAGSEELVYKEPCFDLFLSLDAESVGGGA